MEENKVYVKNQTSIGRLFWTAGFFFTIGIGACDLLMVEGLKWFEIIINLFACYMAWPFLLGIYLQ